MNLKKIKKLKPGKWMRGRYLGYEWMVARMETGHLCGYIRLWDGHPLEILWKIQKYPCDGIDVDCHGGLTFAEKLTKKDIIAGFSPGYWIGWDYARAGDEMLFKGLPERIIPGRHWSENEVMEECFNVIKQLVEKYPKLEKKKMNPKKVEQQVVSSSKSDVKKAKNMEKVLDYWWKKLLESATMRSRLFQILAYERKGAPNKKRMQKMEREIFKNLQKLVNKKE